MSAEDVSFRIAQLEEQIEGLAEEAARSARIVLAARAVAGGGALWLVAVLLHLLPFEAASLVFAIAAIIGGLVVAGSSRSTIQETQGRMRRAEQARTALIDGLDPTAVTPGATVVPFSLGRRTGGLDWPAP